MDIDCSATLAELEAGQDLDRGHGQHAENEDGDEGELNESCHICGKQVGSISNFATGFQKFHLS